MTRFFEITVPVAFKCQKDVQYYYYKKNNDKALGRNSPQVQFLNMRLDNNRVDKKRTQVINIKLDTVNLSLGLHLFSYNKSFILNRKFQVLKLKKKYYIKSADIQEVNLYLMESQY